MCAGVVQVVHSTIHTSADRFVCTKIHTHNFMLSRADRLDAANDQANAKITPMWFEHPHAVTLVLHEASFVDELIAPVTAKLLAHHRRVLPQPTWRAVFRCFTADMRSYSSLKQISENLDCNLWDACLGHLEFSGAELLEPHAVDGKPVEAVVELLHFFF